LPEVKEVAPVPPLATVRAFPRESELAVMVEVAVKVEARTSPPVNTPEPVTESARYGEEVPMPTLPVKRAICAFGSNQNSAVVVELPPTATMSVAFVA